MTLWTIDRADAKTAWAGKRREIERKDEDFRALLKPREDEFLLFIRESRDAASKISTVLGRGKEKNTMSSAHRWSREETLTELKSYAWAHQPHHMLRLFDHVQTHFPGIHRQVWSTNIYLMNKWLLLLRPFYLFFQLNSKIDRRINRHTFL